MEWERLKEQLARVLRAPVRLAKQPLKDWQALVAAQGHSDGSAKSASSEQTLFFALEPNGSFMDVLIVEEVLITPSEKQLVEMLIEAHVTTRKSRMSLPLGEDERKALLVREWLYRQLELGAVNPDMPDALAAQFSLYSPKIPFMLYGDFSDTRSVSYAELKKLLESFFGGEIVLIPLMEKEWLILSSETLLSASVGDDRSDEEEETLEEALTSICSGLYEMLANEWVGECQVAIHYPVTPVKSLVPTVLQLRETIQLGKTYHLGSNLHLPWQMHLEKLLYAVPDTEKSLFVEHVLKRVDHMLDPETLSTLEQFFALDCNVSETAKKLYIHRNTLLYRLDKFKQETGFDVRSFGDASLVKIALLLYKVTKRK